MKAFLLGCFTPRGAGPDPAAVGDRPLSPDLVARDDLSRSLASPGVHALTLVQLRLATRGFSSSNFIGEGRHGPVYKGFLDDGIVPGIEPQQVALKHLDTEGPEGHRQWAVEVVYLGTQLSHPHLVKLVGFSCQDDYRFLVPEFIGGRSLEYHLFIKKADRLSTLPWATRLKIAVGAAKGLAFLHEAEPPVIHGYFKASKILLDSDYTAKLSDYWLAKEDPEDEQLAVVKPCAPPENNLKDHVTVTNDVHSYGVVLLELLTGRPNIDKQRPKREEVLVHWARPYLRHRDMLQLVMDPNLEASYSEKAAEIAAMVAYNCLYKRPRWQPTMLEVVDRKRISRTREGTPGLSVPLVAVRSVQKVSWSNPQALCKLALLEVKNKPSIHP